MHPIEWRRMSPNSIMSERIGDMFALIDTESPTSFCTIIGTEVFTNRPNVVHMIGNAGSLCAAMQTAAHVLFALRNARENRYW